MSRLYHNKGFLIFFLFLLAIASVSAWNFEVDDVRITNDFNLDVSQGLYNNIDSVFKFGRNAEVTANEEVIWDAGGEYTFLNVSERLSIVSTSSLDTFTGLGAKTLIVYGLDNNFSEISEVVVLNGTTPVLTSNSFRRTFRAIVLSSGRDSPTIDANVGTISITSVTSSVLQAQIQPVNGQTLMGVYTIPACKTGYVTGIGASASTGKSVLIKYKFRNLEQDSNGAFSVKYTLDLFEQAIAQNLQVPLQVPEKTDIVITSVSSATGTAVSSSFGMFLIDNVGCVV